MFAVWHPVSTQNIFILSTYPGGAPLSSDPADWAESALSVERAELERDMRWLAMSNPEPRRCSLT